MSKLKIKLLALNLYIYINNINDIIKNIKNFINKVIKNKQFFVLFLSLSLNRLV